MMRIESGWLLVDGQELRPRNKLPLIAESARRLIVNELPLASACVEAQVRVEHVIAAQETQLGIVGLVTERADL